MNENHSALKTPNLWDFFFFLATEAGERSNTKQENNDKDKIVFKGFFFVLLKKNIL